MQIKDKKYFSDIDSLDKLCHVLNVKKGHLLFICYKRGQCENYSKFYIPKKMGGTRQICASQKGLKLIQQKLLSFLNGNIIFNEYLFGFIHHRNIVGNAQSHKKRRWILNIDIKDFFGTINFGRVRAVFIAKPFSMPPEVATVIAQICVYQNSLPQGAPTSPIISNIIGNFLDRRIINFIKTYNLSYTRYVDDITISSKGRFPADIAFIEDGKTVIGEKLIEIVRQCGFDLNGEKSRLQSRNSRQEVTGLIVNKKVNVVRKYRDNIRAAIKQLATKDLSDEEKRTLKNNIYGRLSFMGMVKGQDDPTYIKLAIKMADIDVSPPKNISKIKKDFKMFDVFICHASEDKEKIAKPLYDAFEKIGISAFLDCNEIGWGDSLIDIIGKALTRSKYVIAIISEQSVEKQWPKKELHSVLSQEINSGQTKLLPLLCGNKENILNELYLIRDKKYEEWQENPDEIAERVISLLNAL